MKRINVFFAILFISLITILQTNIWGQSGTLIRRQIDSETIKNNLLGIPTSRTILIYLPPSYSTSSIEYPVVYYLSGFGESIDIAPNFKTILDRLITNKQINEVILVALDSYYFLGGTYYVNSPVTGNWDDFVSKEVISYMDSNFRTIKNPASRAITGFSMGGFGAINLAMLHPDTYKVLYAMSPGIYDTVGVKISQPFISKYVIEQFLKKQEEFGAMSIPDALTVLRAYAPPTNENLQFIYAYGMAFSPNPNKNVPFINYPYTKSGNELICDSLLLKNYDNGFGNWKEKLILYKENFLKLHSITVDYGTNDPYKWILTGIPYFANLLNSQGIPVTLDSYYGGHGDMLSTRIEQNMLPICNNNLVFGPSVNKYMFSNSQIQTSRIQLTIPKDSVKTNYSFYVYNNGAIEDTLTTVLKLATGMADTSLTISSSTFIVAPKDSQLVTLKLNAQSLSTGIHYLSLITFNSKNNQVKRSFSLTYTITITSETEADEMHGMQLTFKLGQNFPNPFNPNTIICYELPEATYITLKVYDSLGREISTLVNEFAERGIKSVQFDGSDLSSGIYFYQLRANDYTITKKMLLMK